ncbi:hypothetical protein D9M68_991590 [compost metagenome]
MPPASIHPMGPPNQAQAVMRPSPAGMVWRCVTASMDPSAMVATTNTTVSSR